MRLGGVARLEVLDHSVHLHLRLVLGLAEALVRRVDGKFLRDVVNFLKRLLDEDEGNQGGEVLFGEPVER